MTDTAINYCLDNHPVSTDPWWQQMRENLFADFYRPSDWPIPGTLEIIQPGLQVTSPTASTILAHKTRRGQQLSESHLYSISPTVHGQANLSSPLVQSITKETA